ncbi:MAG: Rqc2 family fibronectin-binding protein [Syntrophomonadaceae bacterium]
MPFDGISITALVSEFNNSLKNARIYKIYHPEKDEMVFHLRQQHSSNVRLLISAHPKWSRFHLTDERKPGPKTPSSFCMLLRKYLEGGKITDIKQVDFERIVEITVSAVDDFGEWRDKKLICEFTGRHSNIILVNPETNLIIDAIKRFSSDVSSYREVLPGREYKRPPDQGKLNPLNCPFLTFAHKIWHQPEATTLRQALFNTFSGINPFSAGEICKNAGLDDTMAAAECGEFELSRLFQYITSLLTELKTGKIHPIVLLDNKQPLEFAPYQMEFGSATGIQFDSFNQACDYYYSTRLNLEKLNSQRTNLIRNVRGLLDKAHKKEFLQKNDLARAEDSEKYKLWGELLTVYLHQLGKNSSSVTLPNYYSGELVTIELDPRLSPIQNAQKFYDKYSKGRRTLTHLADRLRETEEEIMYLKSVLVTVAQAETTEEIAEITEELEMEGYTKKAPSRTRSENKRSKPRSFVSTNGWEIMVGRNNRQNDLLTFKQCDRRDLWLHAKDIPGSHVIIRLPKNITSIEDIPDQALEEAAGLAAYYSQARNSDKVAVDYTFRYNVRKPRGAKPGMVIYEGYWTIMANPRSEKIMTLVTNQGQQY